MLSRAFTVCTPGLASSILFFRSHFLLSLLVVPPQPRPPRHPSFLSGQGSSGNKRATASPPSRIQSAPPDETPFLYAFTCLNPSLYWSRPQVGLGVDLPGDDSRFNFREWNYSECCSGDVFLISLRLLPDSIQNSSISGVQSWIVTL